MVDVEVRAQLRTSRGGDRFYTVVNGSSAEIINRLVNTTFYSAVQRAPRDKNATVRPADHESLRHRTHFREYATPTNLRGAVGNKAPHARIVHDGRGPIQAKNKPFMTWTNTAGPYQGTWRARSVGGADAQPWIVDAYNSARKIQDLTNVKPMSRQRRRIT